MVTRYDKFTNLILDISRYIQKIKNIEMSNFGLKGKDVQCLYHLYNENGKIGSKELCMLCNEDKAAISRCLKDLSEKGYIKFEDNVEKKYKNHIMLTKEGEELGKVISSKISEMLDKGSEGIQIEEREKFYGQLELISNNLSKICEEYGDRKDD